MVVELVHDVPHLGTLTAARRKPAITGNGPPPALATMTGGALRPGFPVPRHNSRTLTRRCRLRPRLLLRLLDEAVAGEFTQVVAG